MIKLAIRLVTLATFLMALMAAPSVIPALAAGGGGGGGGGGGVGEDLMNPTPPTVPETKAARTTRATHKAKKAHDKQSAIDDPAFAQGYRAAYATIYDRNDYAAAIEQLKALGHDGHPNVANLIGYSYRKLGDYKLANLVRARSESGSEPRADLAVLRSVAARAGQPRSGAVSSEPDSRDLRDRL